MAFVERGVVKPKRPLWRFSTFTYFFWFIFNFISIFVVTMFSKEKSDAYKKGSSSSDKWGGSPGGGGGGGSYPRRPHGMADLRSNEQNGLPACGSCGGG